MSKPHALLLSALLAGFFVDGFLLGAQPLLLVGFAVIALPLLVGLIQLAGHGQAGALQPASIALAASAAWVVAALSRGSLTSVFTATALVGTAGALLERCCPLPKTWPSIALPLYCGAFAGTTSILVLGHPAWVLLAGGLAGLLLSLLENSWIGIGGKLGTTALLAVGIVCAVALSAGALGAGDRPHIYADSTRALVLIAALSSAWLTHLLAYRGGWGGVLGSALPSLLMTLVLPLPLAGVWLGASFVGFTSPERLQPKPWWTLTAMGLLYALLELGFQPHLVGAGGDLGAIAAVAVLTVLGSKAMLSSKGALIASQRQPLP